MKNKAAHHRVGQGNSHATMQHAVGIAMMLFDLKTPDRLLVRHVKFSKETSLPAIIGSYPSGVLIIIFVSDFLVVVTNVWFFLKHGVQCLKHGFRIGFAGWAFHHNHQTWLVG